MLNLVSTPRPLALMTVRYMSDIYKGLTLCTKDGLVFSGKLR